MREWQIAAFGALLGVAVAYLNMIFVELRSIRRMMNRDRDIPPD